MEVLLLLVRHKHLPVTHTWANIHCVLLDASAHRRNHPLALDLFANDTRMGEHVVYLLERSGHAPVGLCMTLRRDDGSPAGACEPGCWVLVQAALACGLPACAAVGDGPALRELVGPSDPVVGLAAGGAQRGGVVAVRHEASDCQRQRALELERIVRLEEFLVGRHTSLEDAELRLLEKAKFLQRVGEVTAHCAVATSSGPAWH
mmetsp:Transcript_62715/g.141589  ORF Transcript_62715/g.141589 Transcript_62715/m.141589 type:complete len:204 (-) Transcript_62715:18-629(-)